MINKCEKENMAVIYHCKLIVGVKMDHLLKEVVVKKNSYDPDKNKIYQTLVTKYKLLNEFVDSIDLSLIPGADALRGDLDFYYAVEGRRSEDYQETYDWKNLIVFGLQISEATLSKNFQKIEESQIETAKQKVKSFLENFSIDVEPEIYLFQDVC